jgi:hypothetical protein
VGLVSSRFSLLRFFKHGRRRRHGVRRVFFVFFVFFVGFVFAVGPCSVRAMDA